MSAHALKALGEFGLGAVKALRRRETANHSPPTWLAPPEHAAYTLPLSLSGRWTEARIDPDAGDWLDRVYLAIPRIIDTVMVETWLEREPDPDARDAGLQVHIGERRVGVLDADTATAYDQVMDAAAQRDELPRINGRLTPRTAATGYLLELAMPPDPRPASSVERD